MRELLCLFAREVGAEWASWRSSRTSNLGCIRAGARTERSRGGREDWDEIAPLAPERVLWLEAARCARWPRLASRSIRSFAACAFGPGAGERSQVCLASTSPLALAGEVVLAFGRALHALESGAAHEEREQRFERLLALGLAAGGAAHDLRNLLSVALLEHARCAAVTPAEREQMAGRLRATLEDARDLAERFLTSEAAAGASALELEPLLLEAGRRAQELVLRGGAARVALEIAVPSNARVGGARHLLARVFTNAIANALEATPAGGRVRVVAHAGVESVRVAIEDRGRGFSPAALARLLEPGASARGGSGFGTASMRACLSDLGCDMQIESQLGHGTRCVVELPRWPLPGRSALLVVDPDPLARGAWRRALAEASWHVFTAAAAREALRHLRTPELRVVLVARALPGGGARGLARACAQRGVPCIEIGALGAYPRWPDEAQARRALQAWDARSAMAARPDPGSVRVALA